MGRRVPTESSLYRHVEKKMGNVHDPMRDGANALQSILTHRAT